MNRIALPVRYLPVRAEHCRVRDEKDLKFEDTIWKCPTTETALVLVDCWDIHYLSSHQRRSAQICRERIRPVIGACRAAGIAIVHAPTYWVGRHYQQLVRYAGDEDLRLELAFSEEKASWPPVAFLNREGEYVQFRIPQGTVLGTWKEMQPTRRIVSEIAPQDDDYVIASGAQLHRLCHHRGILHLLYAGFATNMCVLHYRDYGIMAMSTRGYNVILIRDCTTAIEVAHTLTEESMTKYTILQIEMMFGVSTTSDNLIKACRTANED